MNSIRYLLFPFSIVYGWITSSRNFLFDKGILKSYSFDIPIIAVGNLSVGGTGKTPQIEYLIRLVSDNYKVATLSRGYKRKSTGFILADETSNAEMLGDEPFQFYKKFPKIQVAVDADRKNGIDKLLSQTQKPEVILLDDAFQHRRVTAGFYILLTSYDDLYCNDFMLPTGNLRENRNGAKRANLIIVTKCPKDLSSEMQNTIRNQIGLDKDIFFTYIDYDEKIYSINKQLNVSAIKGSEKILIAGIAKPESFFNYLKSKNTTTMAFPDHHNFTETDTKEIQNKAGNNLIITTEKDFVRLNGKLPQEQLFYLPIKSSFINNASVFDCEITNFIRNF